MKITKIAVNHYGKLDRLALSADSGINLISGENESGKSTLHSFLRSMLFGLERGRGRAARTDTYTHYQPWDGGTYGGSIELESGGKTYSISRNFTKDQAQCILTDETDSRDLPPTEDNIREILCGLTPAVYQNTISVGQLSASPGDELADALRNHMVNLRTTGSGSLNITGAVSALKVQRRQLEAGYSRTARAEADELAIRIAAVEKDLAEGPALPHLTRMEAERNDLQRRIVRMEGHQQHLTELISDSEQTLRSHHIGSTEDVELMKDDLQELEDSVTDYIDSYSNFVRKIIAPLSFLLTLLFFGGMGICGYYTWFMYDTRGWQDAWPFLAGAVLCLIGGIISIRNIMKRSAYLDDCEAISDLYEEHIGELPEQVGPAEIADLRAHLDGYINLFSTIDQGREDMRSNQAALVSLREEAEHQSTAIEAARQETWLHEQKEETLWSLQARRDMLKEALEKNAAIDEELAAIDLAVNTMHELSENAFDSFGHYLEENTSQILSEMTGGAYSGVKIDDMLNITLMKGGQRVELYSVSSGTLDQVYLALRLACVRFLWPDEDMPLFLDDTFALYDNDRLAAALRWLSENYKGQIFIFTCHTREGQIMSEQQIPFKTLQLGRSEEWNAPGYDPETGFPIPDADWSGTDQQ